MAGVRALTAVLWCKAAVTVVWVALCLLLPWVAAPLGVRDPPPAPFAHLLAAAYLALLLGYALGIRDLRRGRDVKGVVWVGLLSNGAAAALLWAYGLRGAWHAWGPLAAGFMWVSAGLTTAITIGLACAGLPPLGGWACAQGALRSDGLDAVKSFEHDLDDLASGSPRGSLPDFLAGVRQALDPSDEGIEMQE